MIELLSSGNTALPDTIVVSQLPCKWFGADPITGYAHKISHAFTIMMLLQPPITC